MHDTENNSAAARPRLPILAASLATALAAVPASADLVFNTTITGGNAQQRQAVADGAALWSQVLADDIEVNLNFTFTSGNFLAFAQSSRVFADYASVRDSLFADATSADDGQATATLETDDDFGFFTRKNGQRVFDDNDTNNNNFLGINAANAKALGLIDAADPQSDGAITVNTNPGIGYDYDRSDGISPNALDIVGIIAHEIGHTLGFVSFSDVLSNGNSSNDQFAELTTLDLFRRKPGSSEVDVTPGGDPFLTVDRGVTRLGNASSGGNAALGGDGFQASHWENRGPDNTIGIMDPQIANGELQFIREPDLIAFDIIGYDRVSVIPEPASLAFATAAAAGLLLRRRRT